MWVVRDFALQLQDEDGEEITSRDYLEKSLHEQNGITDNIAQKNRIRKLIKCYFKERDCVTMVWPFTNESDLQDLQNLPFEKLRQEFRRQITELWDKTLYRMRFKVMNGQWITGPMLSKLASVYVNSINEGAVPNIESAWTYICMTENKKILDRIIEEFNHNI